MIEYNSSLIINRFKENFFPRIDSSWHDFFTQEIQKSYFQHLYAKLKTEYSNFTCFPKAKNIFRVFQLPIRKIKVVIIGQDPYHQPEQATGLAFSVPKNIPIPKSLINIFYELKNDLNVNNYKHGDLTGWFHQGVFLINQSLSVRYNLANSHQNLGWSEFIKNVMIFLNKKLDPSAFVFWGKYAQQLCQWITNPQHLIITSSHPSPLSAYQGFFGSKPFSKINQFLEKNNRSIINWNL
jgi:uracil-DNA glycosylase